MSRSRWARWDRPHIAVAVGVMLALGSVQASAQEQAGPDSVTVNAGLRYGAGGLHRWLFGRYYRDLWTTPITVEVLDLETEGGGLTPISAGGGNQTKSLWFRGADGYKYGLRGVDKVPDVIKDELKGTFIEDLVQDQISSQHPAGPSVARVLLEAAGILRTEPRLVVLPDDPRLGEFRERFAGTLGYFERRADTMPGVPVFDGALEIIDADELFERVQQDPSNRADLPAFLTARLFDYFIGDWDRHRDQWNFLRHPDDTGTVVTWTVLPEDRDQAFAKFDGLIPALARQYAPFLLNFGNKLPRAAAFAWFGSELDRRLLVELEWPVWDSVVTAFVGHMTDSVIDKAVRALPPEYYAIDGARMAAALRDRRDQLPLKARDYYRLLAGEVNIYASDTDETVIVERHRDGSSDVSMFAGVGERVDETTPYWHRRFLDEETEELRIYLLGGADRVDVRGEGGGIPLRIVGLGADEVTNESGGGGVHFYTTDPPTTAGRVSLDARPFVQPPMERPTDRPPRDWGQIWRSVPWIGFGPDVGLFVGGGAYVTHYGFRKLPYASNVLIRGGFSTEALTGRIDFSAEVYRRNSRVRGLFDILLSGIEVLRYNGRGNEVELTEEENYYRVRQQLIVVDPALAVPLGPATLALGPTFTYARTLEQEGRILEAADLYGEGGFGQLGFRGELELDTRDVAAAATRGVHMQVEGRVFPDLWDVESTFGEVHGHASTYLTAGGVPLQPTLALRAGGKKVWGDYPFQEAAFIGDARTVRLGRQNRYGGDAAVYGNAELRLDVGKVFLLLPARYGIFGLGDVGRVFLEEETSSTWHWAAGGGVWLAFLGRPNTLSLALAQSEDKLAVYVSGGFAF